MKEKTKIKIVKDKIMCVRLTPDTHRKMKAFCAQHDVSIRNWLGNLIEKNLT